MKVVENITELIGNTPIVKLKNNNQESLSNIFVKLEFFNPAKSVKDRAAYNMIVKAEEQGILKKGGTIIEPTSGNTGIGIALTAAARGYEAILVMPDNSTLERIQTLQAYGAKVVLTPSHEKMPGAIKKAKALNEEIKGSIILQQFENESNPAVHRRTTAKEIYEQMNGDIDILICAAGTGGTVTGTGEVLKELLPKLKVYVVEPKGSPVLSGGQAGKHKLVGTSPGFIPNILNTDIYDEIIQVTDEDAIHVFKQLPQQEGLFVGLSSSAVIYAAKQIAASVGPNKRIVCIAPDSGERYLSMEI
ncbi:MAG TPA: cysteine synthase A [Virgibacillus sp.]|nr:cysteine synthase A [Virgibacillus sp.]HLR67990.1 cysteine synthase A [Virgibacillus sp.]